jgi:hypothetical protein
LIKSITTPNAIAALNSPATIATDNHAIAITQIANVEIITTPTAQTCGSRSCVHPLDPSCAPCEMVAADGGGGSGSHETLPQVSTSEV